MLRACTGVLSRLALNDAKSGSSPVALEFVRWRRKPRWLPMAKSKATRIIERKRQPEDEKAELLRLNHNYKTQLRSVRLFLREEINRIESASKEEHNPEQEEAEFQRCWEENESWNKQIAGERAVRLEKERQKRAAEIEERLEMAVIREEEQMERIEALVRKEKEAAKTFITREKLDTAIEYALANPVDYNFSMDLKGKIYKGRTTVPEGRGAPSNAEDQKEMEASN